jgi:hypothetical protein
MFMQYKVGMESDDLDLWPTLAFSIRFIWTRRPNLDAQSSNGVASVNVRFAYLPAVITFFVPTVPQQLWHYGLE